MCLCTLSHLYESITVTCGIGKLRIILVMKALVLVSLTLVNLSYMFSYLTHRSFWLVFIWSTEISKSLLNGVNQNVDHISYMFDDETTPIKACGDLVYHTTDNGRMLLSYNNILTISRYSIFLFKFSNDKLH